MKVHRGHTLHELLVVMSLMTVALPMAMRIVGQTMTKHRAMQSRLEGHRVAERLVTQLHMDVHAAQSVDKCEVSTGEGELLLQLPNQIRVVYRFSQPQIRRTAIADGQSTQHEMFALPDSQFATCEIDRRSNVLACDLWRRQPTNPATSRLISTQRISVGRDHRFTSIGSERGDAP